MTDNHPKIVDQLSKVMKSKGTNKMNYADYMDYVLYQQSIGYYQNQKTKIGKEGDFYTSSSVHPVFAWVFADYFYEYCLLNDLPFRIVEIGGGNGSFAKQVMDYLRESHPERYRVLEYLFIDVSIGHQTLALENLREHANVSFYNSLSDLKTGGTNGIIFSNELLDALPVHVIEKQNNKLYELMVTTIDEQLREMSVPLHNQALLDWLAWSGMDLQEGQRIEIPLKMMDWLTEVSSVLNRGLLITVDYGYRQGAFSERALRSGTLRGYYNHQLIKDPLLYPGEMDLTTHIHLDALIKRGEELGLHKKLMCKQRLFLLDNGLFNHLIEHDNRDPFSKENKLNRAIRSFATAGGISDAFHVIVQEKKSQP